MRDGVDVLVPAATGGLLTESTVASCRARLIVGPANNQLAGDMVADRLRARGIVWIPDVVASAGGIIHAVGREEFGLDESAANALVDAIGPRVSRILEIADRDGVTTLRAAHTLVTARDPDRPTRAG